jgi:hypothetical protein
MIHGEDLYPGARENSVALKARIPWYRGLPLSCVERVEVSIDGKTYGRGVTTLTVSGHTHRLDALPELTRPVWFVLDTAEVEVDTSAPLPEGEHDVALSIKLRIPYGDPDYYQFDYNQVAFCQKKMRLVGRDW